MADPATIIGLTSSIITFVDFGVKVVRLAKSVRNAHGTAPELQELGLIAEEIRALSDGVLRKRPPGGPLSADEWRMVRMATECINLATELRVLLATLTVRHEAWSKTVEMGRVLIQTFKKKSDIEGIWQRLNRLDLRLRESVRLSLQAFVNPLVPMTPCPLGYQQQCAQHSH
jgi:hypothetical protein